jgi:hypothetical protein
MKREEETLPCRMEDMDIQQESMLRLRGVFLLDLLPQPLYATQNLVAVLRAFHPGRKATRQ